MKQIGYAWQKSLKNVIGTSMFEHRTLRVYRGKQSDWRWQRKLTYTRNSLGDEIASVNFFYDDNVIVHALQNRPTIDSCINSATDRRGNVLKHRFTKFSKITQCNGHYSVQGQSKSPMLLPVESWLPIGDLY